MRTRLLVLLALVVGTVAIAPGLAQQVPTAETVVVYKTATCGCCSAWVDHVRAHGFRVEAHDVSRERLAAIAGEAGVTRDLGSCHTARVAGYAVEGHVPAPDIARLLRERPKIAGIAVPGMPLGSPGMEVGDRREPYDVLAFTRDGRRGVFARHR
jgi:hypothetical protein